MFIKQNCKSKLLKYFTKKVEIEKAIKKANAGQGREKNEWKVLG